MKSESGTLSIPSSELGYYLGVSQQSASRYLGALEREGFIVRQGRCVSLSEEGVDLLRGFYLGLQDFFGEGSVPLVVAGVVSSGLGEGAYYVREYSGVFAEHLGFKPFHGTLNLRPVDRCPPLERFVSGVIKPFRSKGRSFGAIKYIPVSLSGETWTEDCFLIMPQRTHHKNELEIIARENLREKYGIKDGDTLRVEIESRII